MPIQWIGNESEKSAALPVGDKRRRHVNEEVNHGPRN